MGLLCVLLFFYVLTNIYILWNVHCHKMYYCHCYWYILLLECITIITITIFTGIFLILLKTKFNPLCNDRHE